MTQRHLMPTRRHAGFTLIELLVVVTLAAIMLGIGVPSFREFMATQRVKNTAFDFAAALLLARSEAVKRNTEVTMTPGGGGWGDGWTVGAGGTTLSAKETLGGISITPDPDNATTSVAYQGTGRIEAMLKFEFGGANTTSVRCLTIKTDGVPNTTTASCS